METVRKLACGVFCLLLLARAGADNVTDWNAALLNIVRQESTAPPPASRSLAILHLAIYDAVMNIARTHRPCVQDIPAPAGASVEAAAASAGNAVLKSLYPAHAAGLQSLYDSMLAALPDTQGTRDGVACGLAAADAVLAWRSADGASTTMPYIPADIPGAWRRTPPFYRPPDFPQWPYVTPFALRTASQFRPGGPPALDSNEYAADLEMVRTLGGANSMNRTAEQTLIARFWSDFSYTVTPPGHWNQIAQTVALGRTNTLAENARLFALLNVALADSAIAAWDAKYAYNFWRPVTAIQAAETDGNSATEPDPSWLPLLATPSFAEYVSGHSTFSAAAAEVLANFFGTDHVSFTVGSDALPGVFRTYSSFYVTAEEIGLSRIYGGIHFYRGDIDGLILGQSIGRHVLDNVALPTRPRPTLTFAALNGVVTVSWTKEFVNFRLETTPQLVPPTWTTIASATNFIVLPSTNAGAFFRLVQP